jgi:hypothetical protein
MLKLCALSVTDDAAITRADNKASFPFDRRRGTRWPAVGDPMAVFSDATGRSSLTRVELIDAGDTGVGLLSPIAVEPGMGVTLHTRSPLRPKVIGVVARCERLGGVYRVGIRGSAVRAA